MGRETGISWTDSTWNPIRGCSRVSEGCRNCYAETVANRFCKPGSPYDGVVQIGADGKGTGKWNGQIRFVEKHLLDPLRWKNPRKIFVNSMSDLFHENVTDEMRDQIFAVIALCPQHDFQILTKRPLVAWDYWFKVSPQNRLFWIAQAIDAMFPERTDATRAAKARLFEGGPIPNARHGFSAEDQKTFDGRWDIMGRLAACGFPTFASLEPLLGAIDMGTGRLPDWVIVGGESGPGARPMHPDWARSLRDQCKAAGVPFFFKQWGEWLSLSDYDPFVHGMKTDTYRHEFAYRTGVKNDAELPISCFRVGTKAAGCLLDGVPHHEFPAVTA
jgi:protein gp37